MADDSAGPETCRGRDHPCLHHLPVRKFSRLLGSKRQRFFSLRIPSPDRPRPNRDPQGTVSLRPPPGLSGRHPAVACHRSDAGIMVGRHPGLLAALMMLIRTIYEDSMLQKELPGYKEYARSVRSRLFPKIW